MTALRPVEPIDITGLRPRAPSSGVPIVEYVDPRTLWVDPSYQRGLSERSIRMIRRIVEQFDWTKLKPPVCAFGEDDHGVATLRVLDGQHTAIAAASNPHVDRIPVVIVEAADTRSQAEAFLGQNTDRLGMTAVQLHVAAVAAGDKEAVILEQICAEAGVRIRRQQPSGNRFDENDTVAVAALTTLLRKEGPLHLASVLQILAKAGLAPIKADHLKATDLLLTEGNMARSTWKPFRRSYASTEALCSARRSIQRNALGRALAGPGGGVVSKGEEAEGCVTEQTTTPRFMTDEQLRTHFGLSERAMRRLRAMRDFPRKDVITNRTDSRVVDRFFDMRSGIAASTLDGTSAVGGKEHF